MKTDIEIAHEANILNIVEIAQKLGIEEDDVEVYGRYKAKLSLNVLKKLKDKPNGKLILVTAITPTPAGEGKSTVTVGLSQALNRLNVNSIATLREPSLGPVFGMKGGATGGGYSQAIPMEDINLHFTGDLHAISAAHNLVAACIDNHIHCGNALQIDPKQITWKRVVDMNDRALREVVIRNTGKTSCFSREGSFQITVASEIMAALCLATSLTDLKDKIKRMIFGFSKEGSPLTIGDLQIQGAVTALLKDAIKPNLVQTIENTPVLIHGGPFANIAHGCNSLLATQMSLKLCDYTITEAGFAADLGAEKFLDIKSRIGDLDPNCIVIVATARALKHHGGSEDFTKEHLLALERGFANLDKHIENMKKFGVPVVVAINKFATDTEAELTLIKNHCKQIGVPVALCEVWGKGGAGGIELAQTVLETIRDQESHYHPLYSLNLTIKEKIETIAKEIYGADGVEFTPEASKMLTTITKLGFNSFPVCISKTQKSLSDNPKLIGRPTNFTITIHELRIAAGAGFIVAIAGNIIDMPGLPKQPAAQQIDIDEDGRIQGLF